MNITILIYKISSWKIIIEIERSVQKQIKEYMIFYTVIILT